MVVNNLTNNKLLIDHLFSLGHSISYKDILSIDNNIAQQTLQNASELGMIVPSNIIKRHLGGGFIQAAADNIDFIEETLDGKGTTHATSAVLYQTTTGDHLFQLHVFVRLHW